MNQIKDNFILYSCKIYFLHFPQWLGNTLLIKIKEKSLKLKKVSIYIPLPHRVVQNNPKHF